MIFLNPLFLFGLGAAAIPIIIHLLNLRKVRTIEFSTLSFLKELQKTQIRKIKLRQLILLMLRTLLIVFLVLAFSRPALRTGSGFAGTQAQTTAAIILDNSASMSVFDEHGTLIRQAAEYASSVIELLEDGDDVIFIRQSDLPEASLPGPTSDIQRVIQLITESYSSAVHRPFADALEKTGELFDQSIHLNRELFLISDMQASHWNETDFMDNTSREEGIAQFFGESYRAFVLPLGPAEIENASIKNVTVGSRLPEVGKPIPLQVEIANHGPEDLRNHLVSVYLNKSRVAQQSLDIPAGGIVIAEFSIVPESRGVIEGYVEIEDDALDMDNRHYFTLTLPEHIRLLLIAPSREDVRFLEIAVAARAADNESSPISTEFVTPTVFPTLELGEYNTLIAVNVPEWSQIQAERIHTFVRQGGGFILFPGDRIDLSQYNRTILALLDLPGFIPGSDGRTLEGDTSPAQSAVSFDRIDYDHPIFAGMFDEGLIERRRGDLIRGRELIESPRIIRYLGVQSIPPNNIPVITLTDGTPFLLIGRRENGSVLMFTVAPTLSWSDFPLRGIFVPLVHRSILFSSSTEDSDQRYIAGETIEFTIPAAGNIIDTEYILVHPDNMEERIHPRELTAAGRLQFTIDSARMPGIYTLRANGAILRGIAVNLHPNESDPARISNEEIREILHRFGLRQSRVIERDEDLAAVIRELRYGTELWKLFAFLAIAAAALETIIARDRTRTEETHTKLSD